MTADAYPEGRARALADAALSVIGERGFAAAGIKEIAERAGMAAGTFYLYYPSKEAVGTALIDALYRRTLARVAALRAGAVDPLEKLTRSLEAVLAAFGGEPALSRFALVLAPGAHPSFDARLAEVQAVLTQRVADDLSEAGAGGQRGGRRARIGARILIGAVGSVVTEWVRESAPPDALFEALPLLSATARALAEGRAEGEGAP